MVKKKKLLLEWDETNDENFILGIVSSSSHLEFVHYLNKTDFFNLERTDDIEIETETDKSYFICFLNNDIENNNDYKLIKNKGTIGFFGKEFKGIDYILVPNPENTESHFSLKDILTEQKLIQAIIEIDIKKLTEKTKRLLGL